MRYTCELQYWGKLANHPLEGSAESFFERVRCPAVVVCNKFLRSQRGNHTAIAMFKDLTADVFELSCGGGAFVQWVAVKRLQDMKWSFDH